MKAAHLTQFKLGAKTAMYYLRQLPARETAKITVSEEVKSLVESIVEEEEKAKKRVKKRKSKKVTVETTESIGSIAVPYRSDQSPPTHHGVKAEADANEDETQPLEEQPVHTTVSTTKNGRMICTDEICTSCT